MITTSLEHKLDMVWRTENPNYIIILKNKAGKDMNFKNFELQEGDEQPEDYLPEPRYIITYDPILKEDTLFNTAKGFLIVTEIDTGRKVFDIETRPRKFKQWFSKLKRDYKPYIVQHAVKRD